MKRFCLEFVSKQQLTDDTFVFTFSPDQQIDFYPGQFATFLFEDGTKFPRSYSILNTPTENQFLKFIIKLVENGKGSSILAKANPGDIFNAMGPLGPFRFNDTKRKHVFIATGTGIAPVYSMIFEFVNKYPDYEFALLFGAKTKNDLYFNDEFSSLANFSKTKPDQLASFLYLPVLSRQDWSGLKGHVQDHLPTPDDETLFYVCGQKPMVIETVKKLEEKGVNKRNIIFERYS